MSPLHLAPPDWPALIGGGNEADWLASRDRKFGLAMAHARTALAVERQLRTKGALLRCSPEVLREVSGAAEWYVALLGLSSKMMSNMIARSNAHGLTRNPGTIAASLRMGRAVGLEELESFSNWVNADIAHLFPADEQQDEHHDRLAGASVLMTLGARADGQNRNLVGELGPVIVKTSLVAALADQYPIEVERGNTWLTYLPEHNLPECRRIRIGGRLVCDFTPGGNRPDIVVSLGREVIAIGEIKSRMDLSNMWESWMPQVVDHLRGWQRDSPEAARLFFGTIITREMVRGASLRGTRHVGLQELHEEGALTAAYNLSGVVTFAAGASQAFDDLVAQLQVALNA